MRRSYQREGHFRTVQSNVRLRSVVVGELLTMGLIEDPLLREVADFHRRRRRGQKRHAWLLAERRCASEPAGWFCLLCLHRLANRFQLELHVQKGRHVIAKLCSEHGAEPITREDVRALKLLVAPSTTPAGTHV